MMGGKSSAARIVHGTKFGRIRPALRSDYDVRGLFEACVLEPFSYYYVISIWELHDSISETEIVGTCPDMLVTYRIIPATS